MPPQKGRGAKARYYDRPYDDLTDKELEQKMRTITFRNRDRRIKYGGKYGARAQDKDLPPAVLAKVKRDVAIASAMGDELERRERGRKDEEPGSMAAHGRLYQEYTREEMATERKNRRLLAKHRARERYRATKGEDFDRPFFPNWIP